MKRRITTFLVLIVLILSLSSTASALDVTEPTTCAGTVVSVEDGLITVDPDPTVEGDECTVTLTSDYDHPITTLLGAYFSKVNAGDLSDALDSTVVCVVQDAEGEWSIEEPEEGEECGEEVTVTGDIGGGIFTADLSDGSSITLTVDDPDTAGDLTDALNTLNANWDLDEGNVADVGDDIGEYHDDGYGFGILVKVYAIIEELEARCADDNTGDFCGDTVADLIALIEDGAGMGELFAIYGKPSMVGVGHVRQAGDGSGDGSGNGVCNARSQGGVANATDQNVNCGSTIPNKDKDKSDKGGSDEDGD